MPCGPALLLQSLSYAPPPRVSLILLARFRNTREIRRGDSYAPEAIALIADTLAALPDSLIVFLTAMLPIGELRASIPLAIVTFEIPWPQALGLSVAGNFLPIPFVLYALRTLGARIEAQQHIAARILRWRTARVQRSWGPRVQRYGFPAIALAVAIPLPFTGAWTGALIVWTLHEPARRGLPAIALGIGVAGVVVTALTLAGIEIIRLT